MKGDDLCIRGNLTSNRPACFYFKISPQILVVVNISVKTNVNNPTGISWIIVNRMAIGLTDFTNRGPAGMCYGAVINVREPDKVLKYDIISDLLSQVLDIIPKASNLGCDLVRKYDRNPVALIVGLNAAIDQDVARLPGLKLIKERSILQPFLKSREVAFVKNKKQGNPGGVSSPDLKSIKVIKNQVDFL